MEKLKKDEIVHLRRLDQIDNMEEQRLAKEKEKERILQKHTWITMQANNIKDLMRMSDFQRMR